MNTGRDWCILTMANASTLKVAEALRDGGFDVWAPQVQVTKRVGRARKQEIVPTPVLAGFAFALYSQADALTTFSRSPALTFQVWDTEQQRMVTKGCPYFHVFRQPDRVPWVRDRALDPLRLEEQRGRPKAAPPSFATGAAVKHPVGGFEGMTGIVQGKRGKLLLVCFTDPAQPSFSIPVEIEARQLIAA